MLKSLTFRRHYSLPLVLTVASLILTLGLGNQRIQAYTVPGQMKYKVQVININNNVALFDESVVHDIQISMSETDYEKMITTYQETGEKDSFHANVSIDGVLVHNVGVRLKGNASLRSALGGDMGRQGGKRPQGGNPPAVNNPNGGDQAAHPQPPEGQNPGLNPPDVPAPAQGMPVRPSGLENPSALPGLSVNQTDRATPAAPQTPNAQGIPGVPPGLPGNLGAPANQNASQGQPSVQTGGKKLIPLLIEFDKYVSGQRYQGYAAVALRTYGASIDAAMLQEPLTNTIFRQVGLPSTQTAFSAVRLNDGDERFYSISEVIDEVYLEKYFPNTEGILFKAEFGSTMQYEGEDPSAYTRSFTQKTQVHETDFSALVDFIRFLEEADDATFESELPGRLNVDAFATYLAVNNLLVNTDSIAGMGNNFYLYYIEETRQFTLLMWDSNESLGKLGGANNVNYDIYYAGADARPQGRMSGHNVLVTRFLANATFKRLYEQKLQQIYQLAFIEGQLSKLTNQYAKVIETEAPERELVSMKEYEADVASVLEFIGERGQYLATTSLLKER